MITLVNDIDKSFANRLEHARHEFANEDYWKDRKSWWAKGGFNRYDILSDSNGQMFMDHVIREFLSFEKDMIYRAVVCSNEEWTAVRSRFEARHPLEFLHHDFEVSLRVDAVAGDTVRVPVYIPIEKGASMPSDVYKCDWCKGYTKNDKRGHCAGCGGPRDESAFSEEGVNAWK